MNKFSTTLANPAAPAGEAHRYYRVGRELLLGLLLLRRPAVGTGKLPGEVAFRVEEVKGRPLHKAH